MTPLRYALYLAPFLAGVAALLGAPQNPAPAPPQRPGSDPALIAAGAALYQRSCASCHSVEGRGPSFATGVFAHGGEDAQIAQTIRAGVPGTQMPPFPALPADSIRQLIAYIRSLASSTPAPPTPTASATGADPAGIDLTYERIRGAAKRAAELAHLLGRLSGNALFRR